MATGRRKALKKDLAAMVRAVDAGSEHVEEPDRQRT
jgi:hypothetical protein